MVVAADNLSGRGSAVGIVAAIIAALFVVLVAVISMVCISDRFARSDPDTGWDAAAGVYTTDAAVATDAPGAQADAGASGGSGECVGVDDGVGYMDEDATRHMDVTDVKDDDVVVSVVAPTPDALVRGATPPPHDYVLGAGPAATRSDFVDLRGRFERDEIGDNSAVLGVERVAGVAADADGAGLPDRGDVGVNGVTFDSQERLMKGGDGSGVVSDAALSVNAASIAEESGDVPSLERDPIDDRAARARNRDGF